MRLLLLLLIALLYSCGGDGDLSSGTEIGNGYISAYLLDSTGAPLSNSPVRVLSTEKIPTLIETVRTDSEGHFTYKTELYDSITIVVESSSHSLLRRDYPLSVDEKSSDTFYVQPQGTLKVIVEDSSTLLATIYYVEGTDFSFSPTQLIKEETYWSVLIPLPPMENASIVYRKNSTITPYSTTFSIVPDSTTTVLGGVVVEKLPLGATAMTKITGDSNTLWYYTGLEVYKYEELVQTAFYPSTAQFDISEISTVMTSLDGTFWFSTKDGHIGYITPSGYKAIIPNPVSSSAIQSLSTVDSSNWIAPLDGGLIYKAAEESTTLFAGIQFKTLQAGINDHLWAVTVDNKIYHIAPDHSHRITSLKDANDTIGDIALESSGSLLILTKSALQRVTTEGSLETVLSDDLPLPEISRIASNASGIWCMSDSQVYLIRKGVSYELSWRGAPFAGATIFDSFASLNSKLWLATDSALYRVE